MLNPFEQELTKLRAAKPEEAASPSRIMEGEDEGAEARVWVDERAYLPLFARGSERDIRLR